MLIVHGLQTRPGDRRLELTPSETHGQPFLHCVSDDSALVIAVDLPILQAQTIAALDPWLP